MSPDDWTGLREERMAAAIRDLAGRGSLDSALVEMIAERHDLSAVEMAEAERRLRGQGSAPDVAARRGSIGADDLAANSLRVFFQRARRYPLLSAEEEQELARAVEAGVIAEDALTAGAADPALVILSQRGRQAKGRFILSNLRLVLKAAYHKPGSGLPVEDLVQAGTIGLNRAVEKFDWRRGFKFSTYAVPWIDQSMQREIDNTARAIRLPVHVAEKVRKVRRALGQVEARGGSEQDVGRIAAAAGLEIDETRSLLLLSRPTGSLDALVGEGGATVGDLVPANCPEAFESAAALDVRTRVEETLSQLSSRERRIMELRYGLRDDHPRTLSEVGEMFDVTRERIRQIETETLKRLKVLLPQVGLDREHG